MTSPTDLRLTFVRFADGERYPILLRADGMPEWYPIAEQEAKLQKVNARSVIPLPKFDLPLFPDWGQLRSFAALSPVDRADLPPDALHLKPSVVRDRLQRVVRELRPVSERTGEVLHLYPTRLRRSVSNDVMPAPPSNCFIHRSGGRVESRLE